MAHVSFANTSGSISGVKELPPKAYVTPDWYDESVRYVCVDFDGVLNQYTPEHNQNYHLDDCPDPMPGAHWFLKQLRNRKYGVVILTSRRVDVVESWLTTHGLWGYVTGVTNIKVPAVAYIDDRALRYEGSYNATLKQLDNIRPWWEATSTITISDETTNAAWSASLDTATPALHPASARFHEILTSLGALHDKKSLDYGAEHDPFANVRASSDFAVPAWVGCMIRANDKLKRIQAFARKGELANESIEDSLRDLAVYSIIALVLLEEETQIASDQGLDTAHK